jgi:hypothetical protein
MERASNTQDLFSHEPARSEGMGNRICGVMRVAPGTRRSLVKKRLELGEEKPNGSVSIRLRGTTSSPVS